MLIEIPGTDLKLNQRAIVMLIPRTGGKFNQRAIVFANNKRSGQLFFGLSKESLGFHELFEFDSSKVECIRINACHSLF